MPKIRVGTSGWAYSTWKPDFYPAKVAAAKFLNYYSRRLNTVEVNYTFRRLPTDMLLNKWIDATPEGFQFAIKANQKITHIKRLRDATESTAEFLSSLKPLEKADKLGPVLFQLPPHLKCDVPLLKKFLAELPNNLRAAFEFRDPSWFTDGVFTALRKKNFALCFAESETIETPIVQTADFVYLRLRKEKYSAKNIKDQARRLADFAKQGDVFAFFMHEEEPDGALRAEALLKASDNKT